jgi:hypothetical protein
MIADLDETIRKLLIDEVPGKNGEFDVSFDQPNGDWSTRLTKPNVNLFLYDVRENPTLRAHQWERLADGGNGSRQARLKRTPFRVDCLYMLTTWANEPDDEHRLLSRCLMALFRFPTLPEDRLVGSLQNPPFDIQARLAAHDRLTNPAEVWSALENKMHPSVSYIVTLALDPWKEVTGPVVRTLTYRYGQAAALPEDRRLAAPDPLAETTVIGGVVREKDAPRAGIEVAVKGTGLFAKTDKQGRFVLGGLPPGDYTLVAWTGADRPREKKIKVPAGEGTYDLEIGREEA